jgi:hypothetical protein
MNHVVIPEFPKPGVVRIHPVKKMVQHAVKNKSGQ